MKYFILFLFLFLTGCGKNQDEKNQNKKDQKEVKEISTSEGKMIVGTNPVQKNSEFHASGIFFGRPIKTSKRGIIWDTYEARVNAGSIQNSFYLGISREVSMESEELFNQFNSLDSDTTYIFHYEQPHWINPEIEETHLMIRKIEPMSPELPFEFTGVTKASEIEKTGRYSTGERSGKIVLVKRWGVWDIDCSVELNMANLGITTPESALVNPNLQGGGANIEGWSSIIGLNNSIVFSVYSEEGCSFAEKALKSGRDVVIHYSEDVIEWWDKYSRIIDEIKLATK